MLNHRIARIRNHISEKRNALMVSSAVNIRYLTGITTSNGLVFITPENAYFFTDFRYIENARNKLPDYKVELFISEMDSLFKHIIEKEKINKILYEENYITHKNKLKYNGYFGENNLISSENLIENLRALKDKNEINFIRTAQKITDETFLYFIHLISDNFDKLTETDVAVELEYYMRKKGADEKAFDTICVSGKKSSLPHGEPENIKLSRGFLTLDFGARYNGYCSDMTRTICIGEPDNEMLKIYNIVRRAQDAAFDKIVENTVGMDIDAVARNFIACEGYGINFGHGLGHSVGLEIHESPNFNKAEKALIKENMVITVEPGIYIENKYGVRIEDLVVINKNGFENLTKSDKNLIII